MSGSIFISYRQVDSKAWALLLRGALVDAFGEGEVFLDKDNLHAGGWNDQLRAALERSRVVLVVIGKSWLTLSDSRGPRLAQADDVHRLEISRALLQSGTTVIPVLVDGAALPDRKELPEDIGTLVAQQAFALSDAAAGRAVDLSRIIDEVSRAASLAPKHPKAPPRWPAVRTLARAVVVVVGAAIVVPIATEAAFGSNLSAGEGAVLGAIGFAAAVATGRLWRARSARAQRPRPDRTSTLLLAASFTLLSPVRAAAARSRGAADQHASRAKGEVVLTCAPERAVVAPGEKVALRAWLTSQTGDSIPGGDRLRWAAAQGMIEGSERATWAVPATALGPSNKKIELTATVTLAGASKQPDASCAVTIYVADRSATAGPVHARSFLSGKALLLPAVTDPQTHDELAGYGLYSYLLFDRPPRDSLERDRYLGSIASYLRELPAIAELERHVKRSALNITLLPVRASIDLPDDLTEEGPAFQAATKILAQYDYARAKAILDQIGDGDFVGGPFLASTMAAGTGAKAPRSRLVFDMSRASPSIAEEWLRTFYWLVAKERSWSDVTLRMVALNTRNVVSIAARRVPSVFGHLPGVMRVAIAP